MTIDELIEQLMELKEIYEYGDNKVAMCVGTDENHKLIFRNVKHITLNMTITKTDAGVIIWGS
jgi:hypothetical protein